MKKYDQGRSLRKTSQPTNTVVIPTADQITSLKPPNFNSHDEFPELPISQVSQTDSLVSQDIDMDAYSVPKTVDKCDQKLPAAKAVETSNMFETLSSADDSESITGPEHAVPNPSPIFIYGITDKYHFGKSLYAVCQIKPCVKHASDYIRFQVKTQTDYDKIIAFCQQQKCQYATERPKKDRPLKVVIRKLPIDTPIQDT